MNFIPHLIRSLDSDLVGGAMLLAELVLFGSVTLRRPRRSPSRVRARRR